MKHLLSMLLVMTVIFISLFMASASAETVTQDGLEIILQTKKDSYESGEQILASIEVKNTNDTAVSNVMVMPYASQPYVLVNAQQTTINLGALQGNSARTVDVSFAPTQSAAIGSVPQTGDSAQPLLWFVCLAISLGGIFLLMKSKKGIRFMSLLLCVCMLSSFIPVLKAEASAVATQSITIEKTVEVGEETVTVGAKIVYEVNDGSVSTLTADQTTILVNNSTTTVHFYAQVNAEYQSIKLIDAVTGQELASMLDDGQYTVSGDDLPNDNIYSCKIALPAPKVGVRKFYARLTDANGTSTMTNQVEITIVKGFTDAEMTAIDQVHNSLEKLVSSAAYQNMSITDRAAAVVDQLLLHVENGLIVPDSIKYDTRNQMYTFLHTSGVLGGIMLAPFNPDLNGGAIMTREEREAAALEQQKQKAFSLMRMMPRGIYDNIEIGDAKILYAFDDAVSNARYPHYLSMASEWSERGLNTSVNTNVTVEDLKSLADYKVAVLSMHGVYYQSFAKSGAALCLLEEVTEEKNQLYTVDLKKKNIATVTVDSGETRYWVYASFFGDHYASNDLQNTFIFSEACSFWGENSTSDSGMADAFEKAGAPAVIGFYNPVYTNYSRNVMKLYVDNLLNGETASDALNASKQQYGKDDSAYTGSKNNSIFNFAKGDSYPLFSGVLTSKLIESNMKNPSFEQSSVPAQWNTIGDVRVLSKLSSLTPSKGDRMAILTTGIGSAESTYLEGTEGSVLSQTFMMPSNGGTIEFEYNVVSEEPMEFVNSMFDDKFIVRILGTGGQVYDEHTLVSVNESTWYPISGINFEDGDDTTYHTKWQTAKIDVSKYQGKLVTLQFIVYDVGDSIFDTAVLVDDVRLYAGNGENLEDCSLHLSTNAWNPAYGAETKTISVTKHNGADFSVEVEQLDQNGNPLNSANEWLTVSKSSNVITLKATTNYATTQRSATVNVICSCGNTEQIAVTQLAGAAKPTLKLRVGDTYYSDGDTYEMPMTSGATLDLTAEFTNTKRLFIRVFDPKTGESIVDKAFDDDVTGSSINYQPVIKNGITSGTYVVEATASNSDIRNDPWAQKELTELTVEVVEKEVTLKNALDRLKLKYIDKPEKKFEFGADYQKTSYYKALLGVKLTGNIREDVISIAKTQIKYDDGANKNTEYGRWIGKNNDEWCASFASWCIHLAAYVNDIDPEDVVQKTAGASFKSECFDLSGKDGAYDPPQAFTFKQIKDGYMYKDELIIVEPGDLVFVSWFGKEGVSRRDQFDLDEELPYHDGDKMIVNISHVGIVESFVSNGNGTYTITTIEGNTGNGITKRRDSIVVDNNGKADGMGANILYFGKPNYDKRTP